MRRRMNNTYPLFEVMSAETDEPVSICVWQVRAIYGVTVRGREVTRIEYANGQTFDASETCTRVISLFHDSAERCRCHG